MLLNRLISNRLTLSLLLAISLPVALVGCQSTSLLTTQQTTSVSTNSSDNKINPNNETFIKEAQLMQWSAHYDWQLAQVINQNGSVVDVAKSPPITLQIEPSSVSFYQGCEQYRIDFHAMSAPPYPYYSYLAKVPTTCNDNSANDTGIEEDESVQALFAKHIPVRFNFELLPFSKSTSHSTTESLKLMPVDKELAPKRLTLDA